MLSKTIGTAAGIAVFAMYFAVIGAQPVITTLVGVALAVGGGLLVWKLVERYVEDEGKAR
jgi:peptidoglycan/LPS O-acetylase OafA/YrhL